MRKCIESLFYLQSKKRRLTASSFLCTLRPEAAVYYLAIALILRAKRDFLRDAAFL